MDSFTSAVLFAYLRSLNPPKTAFAPLYTPLLNLHKEDLQIRPEFLAVFKHAGIDGQDLLTLDDLWTDVQTARDSQDHSLELPFTPENTRWILVDHNKPDGDLAEQLDLNVCGVIDHHEEEHFVPQETDPEPRIVENCGSCTSLVVRYLADSWPAENQKASGANGAEGRRQRPHSGDAGTPRVEEGEANTMLWDAQLVRFALASILIDTANLENEDKVERSDQKAVKFLKSKLKQCGANDSPSWDQKAYYKEIKAAKKNIADLDFGSLLRKDYKQWTEEGIVVGISSVPAPTSALIPKARDSLEDSSQIKTDAQTADEAALKEAVRKYQLRRGIEVYALMTTFKDPKTKNRRRELLIQTLDSTDRTNGLLQKFEVESKGKGQFGLEPKTVSGGGAHVGAEDSVGVEERGRIHSIKETKLWNQENVRKSRKQVAPFLRKVVRELPRT